MMNNIGTLYTYELKKIANRKLVWIVGMIMIALSMFLSVSDLVTSSSYYGETSVSAYQAMKFNKDNAEKLSGMAIDDTLLREMQEDCANESKDHTKSQAVTSNNQIAIDIGVGSDDTESSVLKKYFPIYSYVQQITDDDSLTLSINILSKRTLLPVPGKPLITDISLFSKSSSTSCSLLFNLFSAQATFNSR